MWSILAEDWRAASATSARPRACTERRRRSITRVQARARRKRSGLFCCAAPLMTTDRLHALRLRFRSPARTDRAGAARRTRRARGCCILDRADRRASPIAAFAIFPRSCGPATCWSSTTRACFRRACSAGACPAAAPSSVCWCGASTPAECRDAARRLGDRGKRWCIRVSGSSRGRGSSSRDGAHLIHGEILDRHFHGRRTVRLWTDDGDRARTPIDAIGHVPLPPYIKRPDRRGDRDRYQTVYARSADRSPRPTAGLHFTPELLAALDARGVERTAITLHVGYGTFQPIRVDERRRASDGGGALRGLRRRPRRRINRALAEGRRVIAVGTTTTRDAGIAALGAEGRVQRRARLDESVHPSRPRVPRRVRPHHQLPPAAVVAPDARQRVRRPRARARRLPSCRRASATGSIVTATRWRCSKAPGQHRLAPHGSWAPARSTRAMKIPYEEFDLSGVRTYPLASRKSKVHVEDFARPYERGSGVAGLLASLPSALAGRRLQGGRRRDLDARRARTRRSSGASARTSSRPGCRRCSSI